MMDILICFLNEDRYYAFKRSNSILIIDAKYYSHALQTHFDVSTINSGNIYQIFTYVKNKQKEG